MTDKPENPPLSYNPALEKGIDYITSAIRALKAERAELYIERTPSGAGSVSITLHYHQPQDQPPKKENLDDKKSPI